MLKSIFLLGFLPNPRMYKRIALAQTYSDVHLVCWDRGKDMLENPEGIGFKYTVFRIEAGNNPIKRIFPLRKFGKKALNIIKQEKPDIIHVQGLDMLQIACKYKKTNKNVHIIYEIADLHRLIVDKQKKIINRIAQKYLLWQDKLCCKEVDILVITSQKYYDSYFYQFVPKEKVFFFPNVPDLNAFNGYKKKSTGIFTIGYFGIIRYKDELKLLINSISKQNIHLIIAGYEGDGNEIESMCREKDNITWVGRFDFKESAASLYSQCDCIYAVYDASMANCRVALPNKLYEAIYCELPILVAADTYVSDVVKEWGVGLSVRHDSQDEIDNAIKYLMIHDNYKKFVNGCNRHKQEIDLMSNNQMLKNKIMDLL